MGSYFCRAPYLVKVLISVTSNALLTMASLLDTGTGSNFIIKTFLLLAWKESVESTQSLQLLTASRKVVYEEGIVPLLIFSGDLPVRAGFQIVKSPAVDELLGTWFIDRSIPNIFPAEQNFVLWSSRPVPIIFTKKTVNSIYAYIIVFNDNTNPLGDAVSEEHHLCHVASQISIPAYMQTAVLENCQGAGS